MVRIEIESRKSSQSLDARKSNRELVGEESKREVEEVLQSGKKTRLFENVPLAL